MTRLIVAVLVCAFLCTLVASQTCTYGTKVAQGCRYSFDTPSQFWAFSTDHSYVPPENPGKLVIGPGSKLLFDFRSTPAAPGFWFFDMTIYPSHDGLLNALGLYTIWSQTSTQWFRCDFQSYIDADGTPIFGMTLNPGATVPAAMMINLCKSASAHMPAKNASKIAWVSVDPIRQVITQEVIDECNAVGIGALTFDQLTAKTGTDQYSALEPGEAYGYLREFPADLGLLAPKDIAVFSALPLNLGVVSGVITSVFQTVTSHVNLKSKERQTPNMVLLNYNKYPCIGNYSNKPVHLEVASYGWSMSASNSTEVDAQYKLRAEKNAWLSLYHDVYATILGYEEMCEPDSPAVCLQWKKTFGTKASSLGFLRNKHVLGKQSDNGSLSAQFGYDITPVGFGIPFQYFVDFVNYPPNAKLKQMIYDLSDLEMSIEVSSEVRYNMSLALRQAFWAGTVPPFIVTEINDAVAKFLTPHKVNEVKFRSSSNAEDLPGFDGAGLYDSFSADVGNKADKVDTSIPCHYDADKDDMVPSSVECALKGVYGSLWNQRAIEERTYARYKHNSCTMGIAVVPKYKELGSVTANAVAVTRLLNGVTETSGYTFSIQKDDNDVTNPNPGTIAETSLALINPDETWKWQTALFATPYANQPQLNTTVLNMTLMNAMMRVVLQSEHAYCTYKFNLTKAKCDAIVLNNVKTGLDMEFKFIDNWRVHCKQLREFAGTKNNDIILQHTPSMPGFCGYVDPSYFIPPDGGKYINVATGHNVRANAVTSITTMVNLQQGTVVCYANKSNDGQVAVSDLTVAISTSWFEYSFDVGYTPKYIRIFFCTQTNAWATNRPAITVRLTSTNGTNSTFVSAASTSAVRVIPVTLTGSFKAVTLTINSGTSFCVSEIQIWSNPYLTGDPNDFLVEPRTETQDCVWDQWTNWSACSAKCAGGTQSRTRGGTWCVNYVVNTTKEEQSCNNFACPVDCYWNQWSDWSACVPCGWQQRARTYVPAVGTGAPCTGSDVENYECILHPDFVCTKSRVVEFLINTSNVTDLTALAAALKSLFAANLNISASQLNVYIVNPSQPTTSAQKLVMVSFNSPDAAGASLSFDDQITAAQSLSNQLATNPTLTSYLTNNNLQPADTENQSAFSYGIGYGTATPSDSIPIWAWVVIGVGALVVILVIVVVVILLIRRRNSGTTIEQLEQYRRL